MESLTTLDILKEINKDSYARRYFVGVFPRNRLPAINTYPASLILNTDPSGRPGEHWVAIYFNKEKEAEFFDSFGFSAEQYNFDKYIKRFSINYTYNTFQIQNIDSYFCGYYCLYFIMLKSRGFSMKQINGLFSKTNFKINDYLVSHIVN